MKFMRPICYSGSVIVSSGTTHDDNYFYVVDDQSFFCSKMIGTTFSEFPYQPMYNVKRIVKHCCEQLSHNCTSGAVVKKMYVS